MITLHTQRLTLRRWLPRDLEPMAAVNADPEVMRWIGDGSTRTVAQTASGISSWEQEWDIEGFGLFAVELRDSRELAGFVGLSVPHFLPEVLPAVEIGWRLGRPYWGRGIATEAARAALDYGFGERGLHRVVSIAQRGNDASERIMRKLGMRLDRETVDPTCGRVVRVHVVDAPGTAGAADDRPGAGHGPA